MAKQPATIFVCQNCGNQSRKWLGQCPDCGEWNTFVEERFRATQPSAAASFGSLRTASPVAYSEIESQDDSRISSGIEEFDRVLGGGIVAGSLVLIGGAPGIGKSTIVIQMADKLCRNGTKVLYVSGEESERQIKMRGERLGVAAEKLFLLPETNLHAILGETEKLRPDYLIVDSIQTVYNEKIESAPGSVSQVRDAAGVLVPAVAHGHQAVARLALPLPVPATAGIAGDGGLAQVVRVERAASVREDPAHCRLLLADAEEKVVQRLAVGPRAHSTGVVQPRAGRRLETGATQAVRVLEGAAGPGIPAAARLHHEVAVLGARHH